MVIKTYAKEETLEAIRMKQLQVFLLALSTYRRTRH